MSYLILMRHGQSEWNRANRFTGWVDVGLTELGLTEAKSAGTLLKEYGVLPEIAYTSLLKRAIITTNIALEEAGRLWVPQKRSWRLNERHYGALAGLDKTEMLEQYGPEQILIWRRSYAVRPPELEDISEFVFDPRYSDLERTDFPHTESLQDVESRLLPYWNREIVPQLHADRNVLIGAHGNSIRALVKNLEGISDEEVASLEIATGAPRVYEVKSDGHHIQLSDPSLLS